MYFGELLGYIDLSKRRASAEEIAKCKERFAKAKAVCSPLSIVISM